MTWRVIHTSKAERDIGSAANWYENQKHHLGQEFLNEILAVEDNLSRHPLIYPVMYIDIRRVVTKRFPYAIYFATRKHTVVIVAVFPMRRDPNVWKKRI